MPTETVELEGHIVDSLLLAKVLDLILESGPTTASRRSRSDAPTSIRVAP